MQRIVSWIATAWMDIQILHQDWDFLRGSASCTTVAGQEAYTLTDFGLTAATWGMWERYTFRNYVTSEGTNSEIFMEHIDYDTWRDSYFYSGFRAARTRPIVIAVRPSDSAVILGPVPAEGYTITGDYFAAPVALEADADEPAIPKQYRMVIVYKAMMAYGRYEGAPEVYQFGENEYKKLMKRLQVDETPQVGWAGALF
jgi:hypothetical protein